MSDCSKSAQAGSLGLPVGEMSTASRPADRSVKYRAVLFDLFGTLVPCYPLDRLHHVVREMAADLDVPREPFAAAWQETVRAQLEGRFPSLEDKIRFLLGRLGRRSPADGLQAAIRRRRAAEPAALRPRPDALAVLRDLRARGLRLAIVTNCSQETVEAWSSSDLCGAVDHCAFSCVLDAMKPDPTVYLGACSALSIDPDACLFVADGSDGELEGAMKVGMDAVLIRGADDDGSFPGRIEPDRWPGRFVSALSEVPSLL